MALPGGESEKLGNHYENTWISLCLAKVLQGTLTSVHIEPLGDTYSVAELRLTTNEGGIEYHQVKRQHSKGPWNLSRLLEKGVIQGFAAIFTRESHAKFKFISQGESEELRNLTEESRSVPTYKDFRSFHLQAKRRREQFENLADKTQFSPDQTFELLRSIYVEGAPDTVLREMLGDKCRILTDNNPVEGSLELKLRELSQTNMHHDWDLISLHDYLQKAGIELSTTNFPKSTIAAVSDQTLRYLDSIHHFLIGGESIQRDDAFLVLQKLQADTTRPIIVITGGAGTGKTNVCGQILEAAKELDWLTLGIRLDRLSSPPNTPKQLGEAFGLPDSPLRVLDGLAANRKKLLVIDQLDNVSTTSGRLTQAFESVREMLAEVKGRENCFIVLACREYDLTTDDRLRKLIDNERGLATQYKLGKLTEQQVVAALERIRRHPTHLSTSQLKILQTPLFLKIYENLNETTKFQTEHDLFGAFWSSKRREFSVKYPTANINASITYLLNRLRAQKTLSISEHSFRVLFPIEADYLLSERILSHDEGLIGFFHESFFDYLFAMHFVTSDEDVIEYLQQQDQMLHCRGVVRQVLTFLRAEDFTTYRKTLQTLLTSQNVRFHLKRSIFDWLRTLQDPEVEELNLLIECRQSTDHSLGLWSEITMRSSAWFDLIYKTGWLKTWLDQTNTKDSDLAVNLVWTVARERANLVVEILHSWLDLAGSFPAHATKIIHFMEFDDAEGLPELYLKMIDRGLISVDEMPFGTQTRMMTFELANRSPTVAMQVLEGWFSRVLEDARVRGVSNPFRSYREDHALHRFHSCSDVLKIAASCATSFVDFFLPVVISLARENLQERRRNELVTDSIWCFKSFGSSLDLSDDILEGLIIALKALGAKSPQQCDPHIRFLQGNLDLDVACWLLVRMLQSNGQAFRDLALDLLVSLPAARSQSWSDCHNWESKNLIAVITPFLSRDQLNSLFDALLDHFESWEYLQKDDLRGRMRHLQGSSLGFSQYQLLATIDRSLYPPHLVKRWQELERKFGKPETIGPKGVSEVQFLNSPIQAPVGVLTDDHWLRAIERCSQPGRAERWWERGGERELARRMAKELIDEPSRLISLLSKLPDDSSNTYAAEALYQLGSVKDFPEEVFWALVRNAMRYTDQETVRAICRCFDSVHFYGVPSDVLRFLINIERNSAVDRITAPCSKVKEFEHLGLNSDRGAIAHAVEQILWKVPDAFESLRRTIEALVIDPSDIIRNQVVSVLMPLLGIDREESIRLFLKLMTIDSPALLGSRRVHLFMSYAIRTHFVNLKEIVQRMLESSDDSARNAGGQFLTFAYLSGMECQTMFNSVLASDSFVRAGVAKVAADLLADEQLRTESSEILQRAFNDEEVSVRSAAAGCFRKMDPGTFEKTTDLTLKFIESEGFKDEAFGFFELLKTTSARLPDVVLLAFEKSSQLIANSDPVENLRTGRFMERNSETIVRLYEQTRDETVRKRCLDIIDGLCRSTTITNLDDLLASQFLS